MVNRTAASPFNLYVSTIVDSVTDWPQRFLEWGSGLSFVCRHRWSSRCKGGNGLMLLPSGFKLRHSSPGQATAQILQPPRRRPQDGRQSQWPGGNSAAPERDMTGPPSDRVGMPDAHWCTMYWRGCWLCCLVSLRVMATDACRWAT